MSQVNSKVGDTARKLSDTLKLDGVGINLTGATVVLVLKPQTGGAAVRRTATITDAASGKVEYQVITADVANAVLFRAEWEITFPGGLQLTVPDKGYNLWEIEADLG